MSTSTSTYAKKPAYNKSSAPKRAPSVLDFSKWEPSQCMMGAVKANPSGLGRNAPVMSAQTNGSWPSIRTPELMSWGASEYIDSEKPDAAGKWSLSLQFPSGDYPSPEGDMFRAKLEEFDRRIIKLISNVSESVYPKFRSEESVSDMFTGSLKFPKDKAVKTKIDYTKAPTFNPKIRVYPNAEGTQEWNVTVYNNDKKIIFPPEQVLKANLTPDVDETTGEYVSIAQHIPKMARVVALVQPKVWILDKTCGVTWNLQQVKVVQTKTSHGIEGCQLDSDDDGEGELDMDMDMDMDTLAADAVAKAVIEATTAAAAATAVATATVTATATAVEPLQNPAQMPEAEEEEEADTEEDTDSEDEEEQPDPIPAPAPVAVKKLGKPVVKPPAAAAVDAPTAAPAKRITKLAVKK